MSYKPGGVNKGFGLVTPTGVKLGMSDAAGRDEPIDIRWGFRVPAVLPSFRASAEVFVGLNQ